MVRRTIQILLATLAISSAHAQPIPLVAGAIAPGANLSPGNVTATGGTTARTEAAQAADIVNVKSFGAKGDCSTDDSAAINAAITYIRTFSNTDPASRIFELSFPYACYVVTASGINFTGIVSQNMVVNGHGSLIWGKNSGTAVFDAMSSRYMRIRDLHIYGDQSATPTTGFQMGRGSASSFDNNELDGVTIDGYFTLACLYNLAAETSKFDRLQLQNFQTNGYGLIQDGFNHFSISSAFISITTPTNTAQSFNENLFVNPDIRSVNGNAIWMGATARHQFQRGYVYSTGHYGMVIYNTSTIVNTFIDSDIHMEGITSEYFISGTYATPSINGLRAIDHSTNASVSMFAVDTGLPVTSVTIRNADIQVGAYASGGVLLDTPADYAIYGSYFSSLITGFNATTFQGRLTTLSSSIQANYGTGALSTTIADSTAVGGNARGTNSVDWQSHRSANSQIAFGVDSTIAGGFANTASGAQSSVVGGQGNTSSGIGSVTGGFNSLASNNQAVSLGNANQVSGVVSSSPGGLQAKDRGRYGAECWASGDLSAIGDAQRCKFTLRVSTTGATIVRLTQDNTTVGATDCVNIPDSSAFSLIVTMLALDHTTVSKNYTAVWGGGSIAPHLYTRGTGASTVLVDGISTAISPDANRSNGTITGASSVIGADVTNGCLNVSFTPPSGNTDTWNVVASVETVEGQ